jgi:hypothetical protein
MAKNTLHMDSPSFGFLLDYTTSIKYDYYFRSATGQGRNPKKLNTYLSINACVNTGEGFLVIWLIAGPGMSVDFL